MAAFELSFSTRQKFKKKKVSGEIAFALTNLLQIQIQELASRSTTEDDLNICVDERSPCGLSITGHIKIHQCHMIKSNDVTTPQWSSAPWNSI